MNLRDFYWHLQFEPPTVTQKRVISIGFLFSFFIFNRLFYFFFLYHSPSLSLISGSANVFVLGDFDIMHKDWLIYFGESYNFGEQLIIFPSFRSSSH